MALPTVVLLLQLGANHYCEFSVPKSSASSPIVRVSGKMNVPLKPAVEPHKVLFLWPGVNPYGGEGGMMNPVDFMAGMPFWTSNTCVFA